MKYRIKSFLVDCFEKTSAHIVSNFKMNYNKKKRVMIASEIMNHLKYYFSFAIVLSAYFGLLKRDTYTNYDFIK